MRATAAINELWARLSTPEALEPGECWEWPGSRNKAGYGSTKRNGENIASRSAWVEVYGSVPSRLYVLHRCDNPPCVRPSHLYVGSKAQNWADYRERGNPVRRYEENAPRLLIHKSVIIEARARRERGETLDAIGSSLGISPSYLSRVTRNQRRPTEWM